MCKKCEDYEAEGLYGIERRLFIHNGFKRMHKEFALSTRPHTYSSGLTDDRLIKLVVKKPNYYVVVGKRDGQAVYKSYTTYLEARLAFKELIKYEYTTK